MPELPDIEVYLDALRPRVVGQQLHRVRLINPFLLRTFDPPISEAEGRTIRGVRRLGKRIVFELDGELFLVLHLMIAGRLHWIPIDSGRSRNPARRNGLAAFDFPTGTLTLTEAGSKRRASLHLVRGKADLARHNPGGLEVLDADVEQFYKALRRENHTLKRALT